MPGKQNPKLPTGNNIVGFSNDAEERGRMAAKKELENLSNQVKDIEPEEVQEPDHHERGIHSGICHGGPLNMQQGQSRFPNGFVLMDEADSRAWVYDRYGDSYIARTVEPLNRVGAAKAAEGGTYDVRAYDRSTMGSH